MSPFREAPRVELGPLLVGLEAAANRAATRLPSGGRLVAAGPDGVSARSTGALGSAGLVLVGATALVAWATGWQPSSIADLAASAWFVVFGVVFGGLSLAAVFRATDRAVGAFARPGEVVGRKARAVLRRLARLEVHAYRGRVDPGRVSALRRALASVGDPEIAPWIPGDVRGRAQLLLAREIAATGGPAWSARAAARVEVRALLAAAAENLDDDTPARADLATLDHAAETASRPAPRRPIRRVLPRFAVADDDREQEEEEGHDLAAPRERGMYAGRW